MANLQQLSVEITKFPNVKLLKIEPLNSRQCKNLVDNFQNGVQAIQKIRSDFQQNMFDGAEEDMLRIMKKSRGVVEECCKENWCQVVMMQINNKELFRELLWDFECSFHLMCDIFRHSFSSREDEINAIEKLATFYPTSLDEVEEDQNSICERLLEHLNLCKAANCKDCKLAQYLLGRVRCLQKVEGGELDSIIFPSEYPCPEYGNPHTPLGEDVVGCIYQTQWLGFDTMTKVIALDGFKDEGFAWRRASILGGLNHPNIIELFCCGSRMHHNKFGKDKKIFELVMEQGELDLSRFLKQQDLHKERDAIEIMLQIARGVCYLHDMKVAHRNLKPFNVVVTSKTISKVGNLEDVCVKLVGFDNSKVEMENFPTMPEDGYPYGTNGYMAPEVFLGQRLEVDAFKTDVFSFGMMCSEILTTKRYFDKLLLREYVNSILKGERPKLPKTCSSGLKSLIHKCWSLDPLERPTFLNICQILTKLKGEAIVKASYDVGAPKLIQKFTSHIDSNTKQEQRWTTLKFWKFLGGLRFLSILWQMFDGFNQQLSRILPKNSISLLPSDQGVSNTTISNPMLCEVNQNTNGHLKFIGHDGEILELEKTLQQYCGLAFIGMGGIGKSTLAKALSGHIAHQFDVTCYVDDFTNEECSILLHYKSHPMNVNAKTTTLREGQKILKQLQESQKVLIVLDNVGNSSQLDELLGPHIFEDVNGSRLIGCSRNWKSLKRHVPIFGKINMQTLDEDQSRKLFSMHAFTTNEPCLPYLKHVYEKIVNACNGLPLSLVVMGSSLHGEKRLRVWERTLHRLLRARHDGTTNENIWKTLRVSFDGLNDKEKRMFLDIACFFCKDSWTNGIGFPKKSLYRRYDDDVNILQQTLESLQDKSLLKVDDGVINMHNHLRDMGRMIAETEYHGTRIWNLCLATFTGYHIQKDMQFVESLSITTIEHNFKTAPDMWLNAMNNLQLLRVQNCENVDLLFAIMSQTTQLNWLSVSFPSHSDEFSLQQEYFLENIWNFARDSLPRLRVLEVCNSKICRSISLDGLQVIPLKQLTFNNCDTFEEFPNGLTKLEVLEELNIIRCKHLKHIPKGLGNLTCLVKLQLFGCEALEEFPSGVRKLMALEELHFHGCNSLKFIYEGFDGLTCLKKLYMGDCEALEEFPSGVSTLKALKELDFHGCKLVTKIPEGFRGLTILKKLSMWDCEALEEFPSGVCTLEALEELDFHGCKSITKIQEGLGGLKILKKLTMWNCEALKEFPSGVSTLKALEELDFHGCKSITKIQEGFERLTCLKKLNMGHCEALEEIPSGVSTLKALNELDFHGCKLVTKIPELFGGLTILKKLLMWDCEALEEFPSGVCTLEALEELDFHGCRSITKIEKGFAGLENLKKLSMWNCEALEEFPSGVPTLKALEELDFHGCKSITKIQEGFDGLTCLKKLYMGDCEALEEFPSGVSTLKALEELDFHGCKSITKIREGFDGLTILKKLSMWDCEALEEIPLGVCTLTTLKDVDFHGCIFLANALGGSMGLANALGDSTGLTNVKEVKELAEESGDLTFCIDGTKERNDVMRKHSTIHDLNAFEEQQMDVSSNGLHSSVNLARSHQQVNIQEVQIFGRNVFTFCCTLKFLILIGGRLLGHSTSSILFFLIIKEVRKIAFEATLFSTITSSMMEITIFGLLNLIPYWIHRRHHKDMCLDICGGYLFCERVGLCMSMIYVQVCSLWVWSLVCLCHQLPNLHIWSIVFLSFIWFFVVMLGLKKIEWKYRLWSMLKFVLQGKAYILANYVREVIPDLAPCNPFANVVNSQDVDKFITPRGQGLENLWLSMNCEEQVRKEDVHKHINKFGHLKHRVSYPIKTTQRRIFLIGSGWVEVDVLEDDNFRFKSLARGRTIQYFYATLSYQQFSTLLALLAMWEDSPNLGVLENFVHTRDGIYCHCMDLQSVVEALFECTDFIVVMLQKPIKFHIGAKCTKEHSPTYLIASIAQILTVVGTYFQLKDNYNNVAIVLTSLTILVVLRPITSPSILLLEKILVYNVLWCFRLGSQRLLWLYLQLKIRNCFLAFCDDFKPVLHRANVEAELITLFNCTHGSLTGDFDRPDWSEVEADQTPYVANAIAETNVLTSKSGEILEYRQGLDYRTFDLTCQRKVYAESKYDGDVLETQLRLDNEDFEEYRWSEDSYFLFVYLMIKWSRREFGVIRSSRYLMYRRYYHVFNVHELARHIAKHKLKKYKKLLDESVDVMTRRTIPKENAKLDPANKGEMVAGYHV